MNLNQVTVPSLDLSKAVPFYQTLGLKLIVHSDKHYARFLCPDGEATFSIHVVESLPQGDGVYVYFEEENLDEHVAALTKKGVIFDEQPVDQRWGWREARLRDPDGNRIILFYGGDNRINPPWRLESSL